MAKWCLLNFWIKYYNEDKILSMEQLHWIAGSDKGWAAQRAAMVIAITEQYQGGGLDRGEYMEMMQDLVRMDALDQEADDIELKTMLVTAVYAVTQVV
jgi:hypothetical protein